MSELFSKKPALVCCRVGSIPDPVASLQRNCDRCKRPVWASFASIDEAKRQGVETFRCLQCVAETAAPDTTFAPPSEGQLAEMPREVRETAAAETAGMTIEKLQAAFGQGEPTTMELIEFCRVTIARCPCGGKTCGICRWLWESLKMLGAPEAR